VASGIGPTSLTCALSLCPVVFCCLFGEVSFGLVKKQLHIVLNSEENGNEREGVDSALNVGKTTNKS